MFPALELTSLVVRIGRAANQALPIANRKRSALIPGSQSCTLVDDTQKILDSERSGHHLYYQSGF